ncbi:MAG: hypothetical protein P8L37_07905, partial [Phycisphaerales bacterium]|nr:hypothetical protein [Phycisphaerales bacterium]
MRWPLATLLLMTAVGCSGPTRTSSEAHDAAVQWMVEHQNPDGSWGTIDSARPYQIYLDTQASHDA